MEVSRTKRSPAHESNSSTSRLVQANVKPDTEREFPMPRCYRGRVSHALIPLWCGRTACTWSCCAAHPHLQYLQAYTDTASMCPELSNDAGGCELSLFHTRLLPQPRRRGEAASAARHCGRSPTCTFPPAWMDAARVRFNIILGRAVQAACPPFLPPSPSPTVYSPQLIASQPLLRLSRSPPDIRPRPCFPIRGSTTTHRVLLPCRARSPRAGLTRRVARRLAGGDVRVIRLSGPEVSRIAMS